jgi:hypothetical protein
MHLVTVHFLIFSTLLILPPPSYQASRFRLIDETPPSSAGADLVGSGVTSFGLLRWGCKLNSTIVSASSSSPSSSSSHNPVGSAWEGLATVERGNGTVTLSFPAVVAANGWWISSDASTASRSVYRVEAAQWAADEEMPGNGQWRTVASSGARWTWGGGFILCPGRRRQQSVFSVEGIEELELLVRMKEKLLGKPLTKFERRRGKQRVKSYFPSGVGRE